MITAAILAAEEGQGVSTFIAQEAAVVILMAIAALVAVVANRIRFPFTVALVIVGLFASVLGELVAVEISADVILFLLVPPLLFEATLNLPWPKLKADLAPILMLALVGTSVGTLAIGALVHWAVAIPWAAAFAFGALISATDPVAVIALFKSLGAPKRLAVLVEGESLFNDAVAVVAFGLAVTVAAGDKPFTLAGAAEDFIVVSAGGLGIGLILGYLVSSVFLARVDDPLIETSTTLALAYGSFLLAEEFGVVVGRELHFSGILAVVAAGLMVGNVGMENTSPSTRLTLEHFWELLTFLVNSMVFLVIGLAISLKDLSEHFMAVVLAIVGVLVLRILLVHSLGALSNWAQPNRRISTSYRNVMVWAGLRGAISLALVLTIDDKVFDSETVTSLKVMTYGVVLFTLLIQGTTISALMDRLGLTNKIQTEMTQQRHQARIYMSRAGQSEMARLGADGVLFNDMAVSLGRTYQREINSEVAELRSHFTGHPELEVAMLLQARRDALVVERSALNEILFSGLIDSQVAHDLTIELDNRMAALDLLEERWESDRYRRSTQHLTVKGAPMSDELVLNELVYVSWGGTGRGATLRAAVRRADAEDKGLVYLAILDDASFADLDDKFLGVVKDELEWLLDAQLEVTKGQLGSENVPVRVIVRGGDVIDQVVSLVTALGDTEVLVGAPVPLAGHDSIEALLSEIEGRVDVPVLLVPSSEGVLPEDNG